MFVSWLSPGLGICAQPHGVSARGAGACPDPALAAGKLSLTRAGSTPVPQADPTLPLGVMWVFNIHGKPQKAVSWGCCQPCLPPRSSPPAGNAQPAPWRLARKSATQRDPHRCSPCSPSPLWGSWLPRAPVGTGSAKSCCQAQARGEDTGRLCSGSDTPSGPQGPAELGGRPAKWAQSESGVGTEPGWATARPDGGQAPLDPGPWERQAAAP